MNLSQLRVLYLGMTGQFSTIPLTALVAAGIDVCGVVLPAVSTHTGSEPIIRLTPPSPASDLPLATRYLTQNIIHIAWEQNIPVFEMVRPGDAGTLAALAALQPDVACVSCFSKIIPASLLALPPFGFLNLHPSLLPAYRGPHPLFWLFRQGEQETGVTLHFMDEGLDTGDIALQSPVQFPDGISGLAADLCVCPIHAHLCNQQSKI